MASSLARANVLNQLGTILRFGVVGNITDSQLLQRFLTGRDGAEEAAFAALVARHGPMVLNVCRQILGNSHDAEDAFQATFLVLARRAHSVRKAESLASWLHGTALRVAARVKGDEARRRTHERSCAIIKEQEREASSVRFESYPQLHEEIGRLPQRYRDPVVLCYLEGLTYEQAAVRIGCPAGTVRSRLSRARERLRGRLVRRGVSLAAALLAVGLTPPASASLSRALLELTVGASLGFVGRRTTEAAPASGAAIGLAKGVLYAMTISRLTIVGAAALVCAVGLVGAPAMTLGQSGGPKGRQQTSQAAPERDDSATALSRSVDKLESELIETARRTAAMRKDLQTIRTGLKALGTGLRAGAAVEGAVEFAGALEPQPAEAVARLAEQLKRHPVEPKAAPDRVGLYMMDLRNAEVTLIADEPAPGLTGCGSPVWSHNGRRILFDATPGRQWNLTRLQSIELCEDRPSLTDLGTGNCPTFSPADDRIFFLSNAGGQQSGVWQMKADGTDRRLIGEYGKPLWSPYGRQVMILSYGRPFKVTVMDANPDKSGALQLPGDVIYPYPSWAGAGTIVTVIGPTKEDTIALLDVGNTPEAKLKKVLWRRANGPDVAPSYPIYSATTGRCIFIGESAKGMALYSVQLDNGGPAKLLGPEVFSSWITDLASSPDGRYVLYSLHAPGNRDAAKAERGAIGPAGPARGKN
jgi:RNA polymerase sigma factor (sigma-70 family)